MNELTTKLKKTLLFLPIFLSLSSVPAFAQSNQAWNRVEDTPIFKDYIIPFTNLFSALVLIVIIGVVIASGIQYSASQDNPQMAADAKKRIASALVALAAYAFFYTMLEWLIPGRLFST